MLNTMVAHNNTNDQYATLVDPAAKTYEVSSRMTIEFEVDGPYKVGSGVLLKHATVNMPHSQVVYSGGRGAHHHGISIVLKHRVHWMFLQMMHSSV